MNGNYPEYTDNEMRLLWDLIRNAANLDSARDLLRVRSLPSSAPSWVALYEERIQPALADGGLKVLDLIDLLRNNEEYGRQSVFLYRCQPSVAKRWLAGEILNAITRRRDLDSVMKKPMVLDKPKTAKIVDLRLESNGAGESFVLKVVATREYRRQVSEKAQDGQVVIVYEPDLERAVHLFRLHADGLLELRIQLLRGAGNYRRDQALMWELASDLLPFESFKPVPLWDVKRNLWQRRTQLVGQVRFGHLRIRNPAGTVITVAAGSPDDDLAADNQAVKGVGVFLQADGHLEEVNHRWLASAARPLPVRDVHTVLAGEINEFSIPASCTKEDYAYILSRLEAHHA